MARERPTASDVQQCEQSRTRAEFLGATEPALATARVHVGVNAPGVIVLVVDSRGDDELTAAMSRPARGPRRGLAGAWSALIDDDGDIARFHLLGLRGTFERRWVLVDAPRALLEIALDRHLVAVLPRERAIEVGHHVAMPALRGKLVVRADPSEAVAGLLLARWSRERE